MTTIQFGNRTLPTPDTTQTLLCNELTEQERQLLIMNALPTLAIMHICQSMHNHQDEETIVKEIELLIYSINNHHHHHYNRIMMMNLDPCQTNTGLEQTSTDLNQLWHRNTSKINNINLLLLISSIKRNNFDAFEWACMRCFILLNS
ncbi:nuclear receptor, partial [Schistosoma japonicum]